MFILFFVIVSCNSLFATKATFSGFIYDSKTNEPIIGARIVLKEPKKGCINNNYGYFNIEGVTEGKFTLIITCLGYETFTKIISVSSKNCKDEKFYLNQLYYQKKEVYVVGDSLSNAQQLFIKPLSVVELTPEQINKIPQFIESDLLRSLQTLPGITTESDYSSSLYVRGGAPDQNLYLLDGANIYNPEHALGFFSTFNTDAIKKAEMYKGGFGAEYGGRLSSILDVENSCGNRNTFQGTANISLLLAKMTLESPLGNFGSISGSFRRTYIDQTAGQIVKELPSYYFYDGNLKAFFDISNSDKLTLSFYGGTDHFDYKLNKDISNSPEMFYNWGNRTFSLDYKHIINNNLLTSFWFTYSNFNSDFLFDEYRINETNTVDDATVKFNIEYSPFDNLNIKTGVEEKYVYGAFHEDFANGIIEYKGHRNNFVAYLASNWQPLSNLYLEAGLRYETLYSNTFYNSLDPRFSIKYKIDETSTIKFSTGRFTQYFDKIPRGFFVGVWATADIDIKPAKADHYILGYTKDLFNTFSLEIDTYYKKYSNVPVFNQNMLSDVRPSSYDPSSGLPVYDRFIGLLNCSQAKSYGLEFSLHKDKGSVTGWLSYTLSGNDCKVDGVNKNEWFTPRNDKTHNLNFIMNIDIKNFINDLYSKPNEQYCRNWFFALNFTYFTGQPITLPSSYYFTSKFPNQTSNRELYPTEINNNRLPEYMRVDISLTYERNFGNWVLSPYLQIYNVGNRKNIWFIQYNCKEIGDKFINKVETYNQIPIIPTIGVTIKF